MLAPTAETFREFLEQQDFFVFIVTIYVGAGLIANDRRANALQIYLSKPLMRTEYIAGKAAVLFAFLLLVTWVPAILLLLHPGAVRRQLRVPAGQPVPVPGDHRRLAAAGAARDVHDAGAVVAVEEQPLRRRSSTPASSSSPRRSTACCCAITGSTRAVVAVARRQPGAGRRRDLPAAAALRDAVAGLADRHPRPRSRCRSRCSSGACAAWRWSRERPDRHRRARLEVVRAGHRPERRHASTCRRASPACSARTAPASRRS